MKAILDNFKKISNTEFQLKKGMQFARVSLDTSGNIKNVTYDDKQSIEKGDILTYEDQDFEILDINADKFDYLHIKVKKTMQEQDVPDKSSFTPRKMSPRKPKVEVPIPSKPNITEEQVDIVKEKIIKSKPVSYNSNTKIEKPIITQPKPSKRSLFKRMAGWISSKLSNYSNS